MTPAQIALALFEQRRAWLARTGAASADQETKLCPWAALALRAGADPAAIAPDVALAVEDYRRANMADRTARALVADDLCPLAEALAVLARARDAAIGAITARAQAAAGGGAQGRPAGDPEKARRDCQQAQNLSVLALHLGAPVYRCPSLERKAA